MLMIQWTEVWAGYRRNGFSLLLNVWDLSCIGSKNGLGHMSQVWVLFHLVSVETRMSKMAPSFIYLMSKLVWLKQLGSGQHCSLSLWLLHVTLASHSVAARFQEGAFQE